MAYLKDKGLENSSNVSTCPLPKTQQGQKANKKNPKPKLLTKYLPDHLKIPSLSIAFFKVLLCIAPKLLQKANKLFRGYQKRSVHAAMLQASGSYMTAYMA